MGNHTDYSNREFAAHFITASEHYKSGDYGSARREALMAWAFATVERDVADADLAKLLLKGINGQINEEFRRQAAKTGIIITPENEAALVREHSPHMARFSTLMDLIEK